METSLEVWPRGGSVAQGVRERLLSGSAVPSGGYFRSLRHPAGGAAALAWMTPRTARGRTLPLGSRAPQAPSTCASQPPAPTPTDSPTFCLVPVAAEPPGRVQRARGLKQVPPRVSELKEVTRVAGRGLPGPASRWGLVVGLGRAGGGGQAGRAGSVRGRGWGRPVGGAGGLPGGGVGRRAWRSLLSWEPSPEVGVGPRTRTPGSGPGRDRAAWGCPPRTRGGRLVPGCCPAGGPPRSPGSDEVP